MGILPQSKPEVKDGEVRLRILATSDLHMHLLSYDYIRARTNTAGSLSKVATLIRKARSEAIAKNEICLLVDNGDTWQGTPLADLLAHGDGRSSHPMALAMNELEYDAIGIGNHDFDFGIDYLSACITQLSAAVICTNINSDCVKGIVKSALFDRSIVLVNGTTETVRIGVLSSTPDQTYMWNPHHLAQKAFFRRPLPVLRKEAKRLRSLGANVVLVLAHMGFPLGDEGRCAQNQLKNVADIPEVDAVIGGHTHQRFPDHRCNSRCGCEEREGLVNGTPVVQPGTAGSDLGQIKMTLGKRSLKGPWRTKKASASLIEVNENTVDDETICNFTSSAHSKAVAFLERPAAKIARPMNTFFAMAQPSPVQALLATAKRNLIANAIVGSELADMPLLSVASATLTGGLDGPENFICLPEGELKNRHIAGLNPYANRVWAVRAKGARVIDWLERSSMIFNTLAHNEPDQLLINPNVPGFRYDAVFGLSYVIDPRRPPRFDETGQPIAGRRGRISSVEWQNKPLDPDLEFLVATTDHRAGGGGIYQPFQADEIAVKSTTSVHTALLDYLQNPSCDEIRSAKPWDLHPEMNVSAILLSAPEATEHLEEISPFSPETCGIDQNGFLKIRLKL